MADVKHLSVALEDEDCDAQSINRLLFYNTTAEALIDVYAEFKANNELAAERMYSICASHGIDLNEL